MDKNRQDMMNEFGDLIKKNIMDHLSVTVDRDADISVSRIIKNNDTMLTALSIREPDLNISPNIYIDGYFEDYTNGRDISDICDEIAAIYMAHRLPEIKGFDISDITDYETVKDRLVTKIVNTKLNSQFLENIPHKEFGDLSVIAQIRLDENMDMSASITVRDDILDRWNVTFDEVIDTANDNDISLTSPRLIPMDRVIESMRLSYDIDQDEFLPDKDEALIPMYVLSTQDKINGAKLLNRQDIMDEIADFMQGDFIALPSSIHEAIIIPADKSTYDVNELSDMVKSINSEVLSKSDVLSDHAYIYSKDSRSLFFEKDGNKIQMKFTKQSADHKRSKGIKERLNRAQIKKDTQIIDNDRNKTGQRSVSRD
ncbi:MAG: hypothetical protein J6Z05_03755 [Lachnospiraceae bacterium]|nr:hypothetical protein [Lachnospiraceae bacterium]